MCSLRGLAHILEHDRAPLRLQIQSACEIHVGCRNFGVNEFTNGFLLVCKPARLFGGENMPVQLAACSALRTKDSTIIRDTIIRDTTIRDNIILTKDNTIIKGNTIPIKDNTTDTAIMAIDATVIGKKESTTAIVTDISPSRPSPSRHSAQQLAGNADASGVTS
jgi:hypothetical protein